jgi:hypothetical protein
MIEHYTRLGGLCTGLVQKERRRKIVLFLQEKMVKKNRQLTA